MEKSFDEYLLESNSFFIGLPTKATFDQVAAALALYLALKETKTVTIYSPDPMTVAFNRLVGVNKIADTLSGKNLLIRFDKNYNGDAIDRVDADLDKKTGVFQLTVVPKNGSQAPKEENVSFVTSGVSEEKVILVGGMNETHFPYINSNDFANKHILHIGNKQINSTKHPSFLSFAREASAHSEVVASIFLTKPTNEGAKAVNLLPDIATNLLMGIEDATNSFSAESVTAETFYILSLLMRAGGKRTKNIPNSDQFPRGSIPQAPLPKSENDSKEKEKANQTPPQDWYGKPKVFKGSNPNQ